MKYEEVAEFLISLCDVEDNLYPPAKGFRGAQMLMDYVNEAMTTRKVPDKIKYGFKK